MVQPNRSYQVFHEYLRLVQAHPRISVELLLVPIQTIQQMCTKQMREGEDLLESSFFCEKEIPWEKRVISSWKKGSIASICSSFTK